MLRLYITRHGQTEWNIIGRMQGWADSPLTAIGKDEASLLSERLKDIEFDAVYSSPSGRAYDTAAIVKGKRKVEITTDDRLKEINIGVWEGHLKEEIIRTYGERYNAFWKTPHLYIPVNGETFQAVQKRLVAFLEDLQKKYNDGNILIVTHFSALKLMLAYVKGTTLDKLWDPPRIVNASLSIVDILEDGKMNVVLEGDRTHLMALDVK